MTSSVNRRVLLGAGVAVALMGGTSWLGKNARPTVLMSELSPRAPLGDLLPVRFGRWRLDQERVAISLPPDVAAQVKKLYTEVEERTYVSDRGEQVMLTVAYGKDQSDGFKVHRPEVCYAAQGFTVSSAVDDVITGTHANIPVKRVMTRLGPREEPVTYWMVIGTRVVNSASRHKMEQIRYALDGVIADGLLVRVSSLSSSQDDAFAMHKAFVHDWEQAVIADQRSRLFGA